MTQTNSNPLILIVDDDRTMRSLLNLAMSEEGLWRRDYFVLSQCRSRNIPVACVLGGGYLNDIDRLAHRHSIIHRVGTEIAAS